MKIYTKKGDKGNTSLFGGTRIPKHHVRIESYGTIDELNAYIGLLRDQDIDEKFKKQLYDIQHQLFTIGAELATDPKKAQLKNGKERLAIEKIQTKEIEFLEQQIDQMTEELPEMTHFILPGGHTTVSYCHIARCVCRRAERLTTALNEIEPTDEFVLQYLNRLSDYLFVLARMLSKNLKVEEVKWIPKKSS
ncbi:MULTISPECIES: cob(I)yrinic acid a,c-diamide adenosyltransferase [Mesonia]|uniref:Cob(I)yrinic acid a,c-diamide adenosyltransferase n=1 Tax=Mesonia oceanica TaxID=2687242 RepID=A0AC61Y9X2_9FLAO|nr:MULTISPECIES: cob(I)yrinic acid a,c-diamide adenosyltransferase [Mesonia]MAN29047.1 ATP:cob(I)alamin adenosyltransferase [Mesonia sp.]MAQ40104.1 ATP:cob(I)alamin adenosyltransferase [Mesonia sp.]MBJ96599.1 ATP:cob(I)alamin adenosyltransferase [Flavobacteriaceae bacterium]VVV01292.1 Cob(I)yrinic acid a,c-diamide adenosyltransferase [Mesonia oceanica]|tara:strand:+ start:527 stop:1102 length:576 start_codon:yes stop_codon:yes gene_type:complete